MASRTLCASEPWGSGTTKGYALEGSHFCLCQAQTQMDALVRVRFTASQQDPVEAGKILRLPLSVLLAPNSPARALPLIGTAQSLSHLGMTQEKTQVLGSCSSCLDTPPPILVQRSGPLSLRAWAAQTAHAAALARHTFRYAGEQKPRSAPASLSCPKVLVTIRAATLYLCCLQGELGLAGTQEVQSCPHFVGTQQRRLSLQDSALSGENNEAHTHDEAHITGMD